MQMAEHPSEAVVAERLREYLANRLTEATRVLSLDSSRLAEVLIEILAAATGDAEIVGWRFPALEIHEWTAHEGSSTRCCLNGWN